MERLTKHGMVYTFPKIDESENKHLEKVQVKLCAYEDTGLTPEEVSQICMAAKHMMFDTVGDFVRYAIANFEALQEYRSIGTPEQFAAWKKADEEGRLVIKPKPKYKIGDIVEIVDAMDTRWIGKQSKIISVSNYLNQPISYRLDIGGGDWLQSMLIEAALEAQEEQSK